MGWQNGSKNKDLAIQPCTFQRNRTAEEERNLIQNDTAKSKFFSLLAWQNGSKNKDIVIQPCTFKTDKS